MAKTITNDPEELPGYMKQERAAPKGVHPDIWKHYLHEPDLRLSFEAWAKKSTKVNSDGTVNVMSEKEVALTVVLRDHSPAKAAIAPIYGRRSGVANMA